MEERPFVPYCRTEDEYEYHFSKLLEKYPAPKGFSITVSEDDEKEEPVHRPVRIL